MLDGKNYPDGTPIYSFVDDKGVNTHIDSELLRQWCAAHKHELEVVMTPVLGSMATMYVIENVVDPKHVLRVKDMPHLDPMIYCKVGTETNGHPDVLHVDGHHRYVVYAMRKQRFAPSYLLEPDQWKPFQIMGLPDMTQDVLRAMPTKARK